MKRPWILLICLAIGIADVSAHGDISKPSLLTRGLIMTTVRDLEDSLAAPLAATGTWSSRAELNLRPDIEWHQGALDLALSPRLDLYASRYDGSPDVNDESASLYVHEWSVRLTAGKHCDLSYGRENIQWGPSYLVSPSNPFDSLNGKNSPQVELRAADYLRINTYYENLGLSFVANTHEGRRDDIAGDFEPAFVLKFDMTLDGKQLSLLASYQEEHSRAGFYSTWQISDALLFYNEAGYEKDDAEVLLGLSYSALSGRTYTIEYFHNEGGYSDTSALPLLVSGQALAGREYLLRKNYLFLQLLSPATGTPVETTWRAVYNIDDSSAGLVFLSDVGLDDHASLFTNVYGFRGDNESEFGSILEYGFRAGLDIRY